MFAPQPTNEDIGTSLRLLRRECDLTIDELAHAAAVHATYVSLIERGQANPTWDVLSAITSALNVRPSQLVAGAEEAFAERTASMTG